MYTLIDNQLPMDKHKELALIKKAQKGSERATMEILEKYNRLLHKLARKFSFTAPSHQHEDLVQEGRIGIINAIKTYEDDRGASFMTWAYYHIRGAVVSCGRSDRRQPLYPVSVETSLRAYNVEDPTQHPEVKEDFPADLVKTIVEECCGGFKTKRAQIVMDRYGLLGREQLRNCECAQKYNITKYAVNSHTYSFKRKAKERFPHFANLI